MKTRRARWSNVSHAVARSVAGSPAVMSPKSITAASDPDGVSSRFAGCRSPCSHTFGPVHSDAASARSQTRVSAGASGIRPLASRRRTSSSRCAMRHAAERVARGIRRGRRRAQLRDELGERVDGDPAGARVELQAVRPVEPRHDAPRHVVAELWRGSAVPHGCGHRHGQARCELGEPALLVADQSDRRLAARHPHRVAVAEPEDGVVPPVRDEAHRADEVGVLRGDEAGRERLVDVEVGRRGIRHLVPFHRADRPA